MSMQAPSSSSEVQRKTLRRLAWIWRAHQKQMEKTSEVMGMTDVLKRNLAESELAVSATRLRNAMLKTYRRHLQEQPEKHFSEMDSIIEALDEIGLKYGNPAPWSADELAMLKEGLEAQQGLLQAFASWTETMGGSHSATSAREKATNG